jgi:hypothetical protein
MHAQQVAQQDVESQVPVLTLVPPLEDDEAERIAHLLEQGGYEADPPFASWVLRSE